jgi:predicted amino acid dehydrogenase
MKAVDNINANNSIIASTEKALAERKQYDINEAKRIYDAGQEVIRLAGIETLRVAGIEQKRIEDATNERIRLAGIEQKRIDDAAQKVITDAAIELAKTTAKNLADAKSKEQDIKKEIDLKLVEKGVVPEAVLKQAELAGQAVVEAAKINATAQAKVTELTGVSTISNKKYFIIGGVLLAIFGAYFFFGKKSNN